LTVGLGLGVLAGVRLRRYPDDTTPDEVLTSEDQAAIEVQFRQHAAAIAEGVSDYADVLAAGDPLLRARLRKVEAHLGRGA